MSDVDWVPIVMFIGLTVVFSLVVWFRFRTRREMQATLRTAIDKGQEITPEIAERLGSPKPPPNRDLRFAFIWLAIALSLAIFGLLFPHGGRDMLFIMLGSAAFPFCIGVAYYLMWRFTETRG